MQMRALVVGSALVLAACGGSADDGPTAQSVPETAPPTTPSTTPSTTTPSTTTPRATTPPTTTTTTTVSPPTTEAVPDDWPKVPPPVVFRTPDGPLARSPFTVCWTEPRSADPTEEYQSYCADGVPEVDPPLVGPQDEQVVFTFDVADWTFSASEQRSGEALAVEQLDETTWAVSVPGDAVDGDGVVIVSGYGPAGDLHVAISLPTTGALEESAAECIAARDALHAGLPAYEYEPAADMISLIDGVDAVVLGTIDGVLSHDGEIELVLAEATTWGGHEKVTSVVTRALLDDVSVADPLTGTPMIAFVHRRGDGRFGADVQGVHLQCPGGPVHLIEPLPDDPRVAGLESIDTLAGIASERKAPVRPDDEIHEVAAAPPAAVAVGDTVPIQLWWRCSVGLSVQVGDDIYLAEGAIEGLVPRPAREWVRDDFPDDWEVVIYNDVPVDGDDWVMLDAVAERIDDTTLEVRHVGTDETVGRFVLDATPSDERSMCG